MSTIYRLHLAETPKDNLKYGWLRQKLGNPEPASKITRSRGQSLNPF
ncbi:MAG: hypothetical protein IJE97_03290 [Thermoguttaceae bacterium]|nr:hypothetical protein [Thermoguttaceae bacterium]